MKSSPRQRQFEKTSFCTRHFHEIKPSPVLNLKNLVQRGVFTAEGSQLAGRDWAGLWGGFQASFDGPPLAALEPILLTHAEQRVGGYI